jgi:hypothetical protein
MTILKTPMPCRPRRPVIVRPVLKRHRSAACLSISSLAMLNPYQKRLITAAVSSVGVVLVLYAGVFGAASNSTSDESSSQLRIGARPGDLAGLSSATAVDILEKSALNSENCPHMKPAKATAGKPIWIAVYPGSGFDLVAPLISAVTGLTSVDVYRQHGCSEIVREGAAPTGACLTHWPLVQKDSPASVAVATGTMYYKKAIFVVRNPAHAIPSYHTRWWGAQHHVRGNHDQPPVAEWIDWRDKRFDHHLQIWKLSLTEWERGVPTAGLTGISLYLPFEQLTSVQHGPALTAALANEFASAQHPTTATNTACLWRRVVDDEHHAAKVYAAAYTAAQKALLLKTLDDLMLTYATTEPVLTGILQGYRTDIASNLPLDDGAP